MRTLMPACMLLACLASAAYADIGPKPREYAPGLEVRGDLEGIEVEMAEEDVTVTLKATGEERHEKLIVDAVFHMKNLGAAVEIEEGFPVGPINNMEEFRIEIDGKAADFELVDVAPGPKTTWGKAHGRDVTHDYWYVWKASFAASSQSRHVVHYEVDLHHRYYTLLDTAYILHTGAPWKNPIGRATVTLRLEGLTADRIYAVAPVEGLRREQDTWIWSYENLEPTADSDIRIRYDSEQAWEDDIAERKPMARDFLGAKFWVSKRLLEAASRQGRATMTGDELKDACEALRSCLDGASEKDGVWTVPIQPEGSFPTTAYDWGEFLYETYPDVVGLGQAHSDSECALETLRLWHPIAEAFAEGKLETLWEKRKDPEPAKVQEYVKEGLGARFDAARERARALLGGR